MSDIIEEIDSLIDEQLTAGEARSGFDFGDPQYPKCWHCGRHWHGLPITQRIAEMYAAGRFDEGYRVDTDTSRVMCQGSDFIGPMPSTSGVQSAASSAGLGSALIDIFLAIATDIVGEPLTAPGVITHPDPRMQYPATYNNPAGLGLRGMSFGFRTRGHDADIAIFGEVRNLGGVEA